MPLNISEILNSFFRQVDFSNNVTDFLEQEKIIIISNLFKPSWEKLRFEYNQWIDKTSMQDKFEDLKVETSEIIKFRVALVQDFLRNKIVKTQILTIIEIFLYNIEEILTAMPFFDKFLYKSLSMFMDDTIKVNTSRVRQLFEVFFKETEEKFSFFTILSTILIFREKKDIESLNEAEISEYISDWTIKYAQLIEGPIKNILLFLLRLSHILRRKNYDYLDSKGRTIRYVINKLNIDEKLAKLRNPISHQSIILTKELEIKEKKIIFKDIHKKIILTLTLEEFYNEFYNSVIFLITFYSVWTKKYIEFYETSELVINKILLFTDKLLDDLINLDKQRDNKKGSGKEKL